MACAIGAFILSMLCLFAGHKPGYMEDYHIITLNTSTLGHNLIPTKTFPTTTSASSTPTATSLGSFFSNVAHNITATIMGDIEGGINTIESGLNDIGNDIADKLASELGIKQWYSLHLMDLCEGTYTPNATQKHAKLNVTSCTKQTGMFHFDISQRISQELKIGPLHLNLTDIQWPDEIQDGIDALNTAMDATFVLYAIGIASAGLAILTSIVAIFLSGSRLISLGNWGLATLAFSAFFLASLIITIVQSKMASLINKHGNEIGLYAYKSGKYLALTWVATAVMFLATVTWTAVFFVEWRGRRREYREKPVDELELQPKRKSWRSSRRSGA